jgi:hypothetical protein
MRSLQTARPELGPLPYSENLAVSEDLKTVWLFEGRGILKVGAHTAGHNYDGVGWGVFGNFDKPDGPAARVLVDAIQQRATELKGSLLPNLGSVGNPKGWVAWGHRDTSTKTCPGNYLYPLLATFDLEDDMPLSDADIQKIAQASALATANVKVKRSGQTVSWIQETADIKTMLLLQSQDANHLTDSELDAAVNNLVVTLPAKVLSLLKAKL